MSRPTDTWIALGRAHTRLLAGVEAALKWPNDLVAGGGKLAGVLAESVLAGDTVAAVVVGSGCNVGWHPEGVGATSLAAEAGRPVVSRDTEGVMEIGAAFEAPRAIGIRQVRRIDPIFAALPAGEQMALAANVFNQGFQRRARQDIDKPGLEIAAGRRLACPVENPANGFDRNRIGPKRAAGYPR